MGVSWAVRKIKLKQTCQWGLQDLRPDWSTVAIPSAVAPISGLPRGCLPAACSMNASARTQGRPEGSRALHGIGQNVLSLWRACFGPFSVAGAAISTSTPVAVFSVEPRCDHRFDKTRPHSRERRHQGLGPSTADGPRRRAPRRRKGTRSSKSSRQSRTSQSAQGSASLPFRRFFRTPDRSRSVGCAA